MRSLTRSIALAAFVSTLLLAAPGAAQTQFQSLSFPAPGWYFVSLQVEPVDDDPLMVFPVLGGFEYDHLWGYDPDAGWRHFSPAFAQDPALDSFNDLTQVEALRGYWIRVTRVPSPSFALSVEGDPVVIQRLTGAGWQAIGPLLPVGASPANMQEVFSTLGPALSQAIPEAWGFDAARNEFAPLLPADADCSASPLACLSPGLGYWILTTGDLAIGQEFSLTPDELVLTTESPLRKLVISYSGSGAAAGTLRPSSPGTGVRFRPARFSIVDGTPIAEPDPAGGSADGPDTDADLDGDGALEVCPDLCGGAPDCVNLCFSDPSRSHSLYVELSPDALYGMETFTSPDPGQEFAVLEIDLGGGASSSVRAGGLPSASNVVASVPLAVRPPLLVGEWAGSLFYDGDVDAEVAVRIWMDDCVQSPGGGPQSRECDGSRLTGIINPTIVGSSSNALDDDGDGDVDEPDEQGAEFRTGETPSFPDNVVLRGTSASGNSLLRLEGTAMVGEALSQVTDVACVGGVCEDGSGTCSDDSECPRNAGLGLFFDQTVRTLSIEGQRTSADTFAGTFTDRFDAVVLAENGSVEASGRFTLQKISAPQCVVRDPSSSESVSLDVSCRSDSDCPRRCIGGDSSLDGFSCMDDTDCVATLVGGQQVTASCLPFACAFVAFGGPSANALDHARAVVPLTTADAFDLVSLELLGTGQFLVVRPGDLAGVDLGLLRCGPQDVRLTASNCAPQIATIADVCAPVIPAIPFVCSGTPATPSAGGPALDGAGLSLVGAATVTGAATFQLDNPSPDCAGCVARWEDGGGVPVPAVLSDGASVQLLGIGAADAVAAVTGPDSWTDFLTWPPSEGLRAGALHLLKLLAGAGP